MAGPGSHAERDLPWRLGARSPRNHAETGSGSRASRKEFTTSSRLEPAMTAAASIGLQQPERGERQRHEIVAERPHQIGDDGLAAPRGRQSITQGSMKRPSLGSTRDAVSRASSVAEPTAMPTSASASTGPR